ncbi:MAG TPA: hypothetical protein VF240_10295 [Pyrinomonadaceae bacterium]
MRPLLSRLFAALLTFASGVYASGLWYQLHECNAMLGPLCCGMAPQ